MKNIILIFTLLCSVTSLAYSQNSREIEVKGTSELLVKPDQAIIQIHLEEKAMKVADATEKLNAKASEIEKKIRKEKFKDYKFTANNYYVNINRVYRKGTSKDSGYVASQNLKLELYNLEKDLPKAVELLNISNDLTFNVSFSISKEMVKSYEEQLLKMALEDAQNKADQIGKVMKLENLMVKKVNYGHRDNVNYPRPVQMEAMRLQKSQDREAPVFQPEEQQLTDEVLVTFSFEN
ncbi:SIMPL domain-containing protein [Echinicola jeungdonensis]|uniref:SIMPL domain-containing protein n=1 Tax=Echinicola jeungdonensis TaxID=709343 RepID=A0ABV5J856_9BACT|nr:SIMPL domain-containing protein [Echinicola jeungdonensis]MDN3669928.1 SIMPL domain-containing protein [Echinicola jeungdonensis]